MEGNKETLQKEPQAILDFRSKLRAACLEVLDRRDELGIGKEQIIGMGDGANDLKFMGECAVGIAYHAKPVVRAQATHALTHVGLDGVLNLFN